MQPSIQPDHLIGLQTHKSIAEYELWSSFHWRGSYNINIIRRLNIVPYFLSEAGGVICDRLVVEQKRWGFPLICRLHPCQLYLFL